MGIYVWENEGIGIDVCENEGMGEMEVWGIKVYEMEV